MQQIAKDTCKNPLKKILGRKQMSLASKASHFAPGIPWVTRGHGPMSLNNACKAARPLGPFEALRHRRTTKERDDERWVCQADPSRFAAFLVKTLALKAGLWDQGVYTHFCDTREPPLYIGGLVFGRPFWLYHRSGHFPQPCLKVSVNEKTHPSPYLKVSFFAQGMPPPTWRLFGRVSMGRKWCN